MAARKKKSAPQAAAEAVVLSAPEKIRWLPLVTLLGLLCIFAIRMTISESMGPALSTRIGNLSVPANERFTGPQAGTTLALAGLTIALSAIAPFTRRLRKIDAIALALIGLVTLLSLISTVSAANKFAAMVGTIDLLAALLGGWSIALLASSRHRRTIIIATILAILSVWAARGLVQHFIDTPDTIRLYNAERLKILAQQGIAPDSPEEHAFKSRMLSGEIGGFIALSNVYANGLVGLITAAVALICAALFAPKPQNTAGVATDAPPDAESPRKKTADTIAYKSRTTPIGAPRDVPLPFLLCGIVMVIIASASCLAITESKGATAALILSALAIAIGAWKRDFVAKHAKRIAIIAAALLALGLVAMVGYGIAKDTLPSKSMMFRWHYWTATTPLIRDHALLGVGFNNFGDYYSSQKRPSSPEDVKDPHSFFVRLAAEGGLPLMLATGGILAVYFIAAVKRRTTPETPSPLGANGTFYCGAALCFVWWSAQFLIGEPDLSYYAMMAGMYGLCALIVFFLAAVIMDQLTPRGESIVLAGLLVGAAGMFLYDQVNMALITGPVAALFWVMLATSGASDDDTSAPVTPLSKITGSLLAVCGTAALILCIIQAKKLLPWDPTPHIENYAEFEFEARTKDALVIRPATTAAESQSNYAAKAERTKGLAELDAAIALAPRDISLLRARIQTKRYLGLSTADDIRTVLKLDRANSNPRMLYGLNSSDLTTQERIDMLQEALKFDAALPADEAKRLKSVQLISVMQEMLKLDAQLPADSVKKLTPEQIQSISSRIETLRIAAPK